MDDYDIYKMNLLAHAIIELNEKAGHVIDPDLEERIRIAFKHIFDESNDTNKRDDEKDKTKFLLTSVVDCFGDGELLEYVDKLREAGFDVYTETPDDSKRYRDHYIYVNSINDLIRLIDTVGYEIVISRSYKGDPPCIQIYDNYRE